MLFRSGCLLVIFNVVILAPIFEELFFRGYIYRLWKRHMGVTKALVLSSLIFAAVHFMALLHLFVIAIVLAKIYDYYENIWPSIIAHGVMNAAVISLGYSLVY
mgnify:FL=1